MAALADIGNAAIPLLSPSALNPVSKFSTSSLFSSFSLLSMIDSYILRDINTEFTFDKKGFTWDEYKDEIIEGLSAWEFENFKENDLFLGLIKPLAESTAKNIDLYKLRLDTTSTWERITYFNVNGKFKATNPVVSDDGKFIAFMVARCEEMAG